MEQSSGKEQSFGLTAKALKLLAIGAMLIDHIAWAFVPTESVLGFLMHLIGRITAPIMCFFIAEGYFHTRSVPKYALRLGVFALISYLPFVYYETGGLPNRDTLLILNVIYTLLLGLGALWIQSEIKTGWLRALLIVLICILALPGDWLFFGVLYVLIFGKYHGDFQKQAFWFTILSAGMLIFAGAPLMLSYSRGLLGNRLSELLQYLPTVAMQLGVFLALPLLKRYNGKRGGGASQKWLFYLFYPTHLLLLGLLRWVIV